MICQAGNSDSWGI